MAGQFTGKAQNALNRALLFAREMGHTYIGSEHILLGLLSERDGVAARLLEARGISAEDFKRKVEELSGSGEPSAVTPADMTPRVKKIIELSAYESARGGQGYIGTEHLLLALAEEKDCVAVKLLESAGISADAVVHDISDFFSSTAGSAQSGSGEDSDVRENGYGTRGERRDADSTRQAGQRFARPGIPNAPTISQYGRNLCALAKEGRLDPIIGREKETERVVQILSRRTKNNPCLIGEPGVGKTAVVEGLAERIVDGSVPETLIGKLIVTLDVSAMVAGSKFRGEFEERLKNVMNEAAKNPSIILFIDELHNIIGAGAAEGAVDAANIIKPALARGEMQVIGATTIAEYRKHIEKDAALERRFQSVMIDEPSAEEAVLILRGLRDKYEAHHKLKITDEAIDAAVKLSVRYINDRYLPDKAIDLIDEACSKVRIAAMQPSPDVRDAEAKLKSAAAAKEEAVLAQDFELAARLRDEENKLKAEYQRLTDEAGKAKTKSSAELSVGAQEIAEIVTSWTGIPVSRLAEEESERLGRLEDILKERVVGQDEAVSAVARAIRRGRTGLKDPRRPIGSFIFLGPTGVGKTELCRVLADVMFGSPEAMIRVDMSEYMEKYSVSKLIGSPPGYIGYDEGGQLTEKIRRRPYSVVLFDEIEKAHPDVFNIMLQILDDGALTDAQGRRVDFKNTVVIMTGNVGASQISEAKRLGFSGSSDAASADKDEYERMKASVTESLKTTFRPEFLNRVDEIIIFRKLSDESIRKIALLMLGELKARVAALGITLGFDDSVTDAVAKAGFDPVYGARPLRRAIVSMVEDKLSEAMVAGEVKQSDTVTAVMENGSVAFKKV